MLTRQRIAAFCTGLLLIPLLTVGSGVVHAQTEAEKLQAQIDERNARLDEIEQEITKYEAELQKVGAEKSSLNKAIGQLELERKKVLADISYTENKINNTDLEIDKLGLEINTTEEDIAQNEAAISEIIRTINTNDGDSMIEIMLAHENLSEFWNSIEELDTVQTAMKDHVNNLLELKGTLENKQGVASEKRNSLLDLKNQYTGQQAVLANNKAQKNKLLAETQNKEENYQTILAEKQAAREQLQKEVEDIESQLQFILDPSTIPNAGTSVFNWPLDNIIITQYFGYTKFALSGAYSGSQHNGVDFGVPVGTKLYAPLSGTIRATGDTDQVPGCYSWGKWILVDHPNGLSSLFAHLSYIGVASGQSVKTGDVIGLTGATGYVTGPHLHYSLYVSAAVQVKKFNEFKSVTSCGPAASPFAAIEGYLNPLDYLPSS